MSECSRREVGLRAVRKGEGKIGYSQEKFAYSLDQKPTHEF